MAEASPPDKSIGSAVPADLGADLGADARAGGESASVRGLNRLLDDARGTLRAVGVAEAVIAAVAAAVGAVIVACVVVGAAPFSLLLRDALLALVAVVVVAAAVAVAVRRLWPLQRDFVIGARLEAALRRRGLDVRDLVRSAVELRDAGVDERFGRSRALCDAHIGRAVDVVRSGQALTSLTRVALEAALPTLLSAAVIGFVAGLWWVAAPESLSARLARLFDRGAVDAALAERALSQAPLVTDLTITLRFPAYMSARDEVIPGASGDVTAPRGTEVIIEGRADRLVDSAALVVSGGQADPRTGRAGPGELALAAEVKDQRNLRAKFVVDKAGAWRFRVVDKDGDTILDPVARKIVLRDDAAPSVTLDAPEKDMTVQIDDDVDLAFGASDDVGVTEVRVVVKRHGSARQPYVKKLQDVPGLRQVRGRGEFNVGDVGARPGEKLAVTIEAVDNDTISGPKVGRSTTRVLTVFSATQHHREVIQRLDALLGQMVEVLGDELEAPFAPEKEASGMRRVLERNKQTAPRATAMLALFDETLAAVGSDELLGKNEDGGDDGVRRALANMRLELQKAVLEKLTAVERTPLPVADRATPPALWRRLVDTQAVFTTRLEKHILYLEDLLQRERVLEAQKLVKDMKRAQQDLKELLQQYKESGDPATRDALLDEIRRMQQQLQELAARLGELRREVPDEYLNEEAFKSGEMMEQAESLDEMIEEGRLEDAAKALESMLEQTEKMVDELEKSEDEMGGQENKELREKMERFGQELAALEQAQQEELQETERAMEQARKKAEQQLKAQLEKALSEAKKKAQKAQAELAKVPNDGLSPLEEEDVEAAKARTADLQRALDAGDVEDALRTAEEAEAAARSAEQSIDDKQRGRFQFSSKTLERSEKALQEAGEALAEARKALEDAMPDPSEMMDGKERDRLGKQGERQQQLGEQAQKLGQLLDEIGKDAPIFGPEHKKQVDDARQAMERASRQLKGQSKGRGERDGVRGARQSQSQALQQLRALQKAMSEMGKGSGGGGGGIPLPLPGGGAPGSEREEREGSRGASKEEVKIPDGSDFKVKDAFRKDILDAMREGAPEDWAGEVKRYYEELIK